MSCPRGCGPSKHSPEYEKQQKPENHAGCCAGCQGEEPKEAKPKRIRQRLDRNCFIRYISPY